MNKSFIGEKVIIRGEASGVFYGVLQARDGREVHLRKCRRIWYWDGAATLSQLAAEGTLMPDECKVTMTIDDIVITDVIEIIPCTDKAISSIEGVIEWKIQ